MSDLKQYIDRFENVQNEVDAAKADQKEILEEVTRAGFDAKAFKKVISIRRKELDAYEAEEHAVQQMMITLGMA